VLEHLGLIGVSWRQGGSEALAEFALDQERAPDKLRDFAQRLGLKELAYLSTCNRVELIFARGERTPGQDLRAPAFALLTGRSAVNGEAERRLRAWHGEGAAEHLFLTAAGFDSACVLFDTGTPGRPPTFARPRNQPGSIDFSVRFQHQRLGFGSERQAERRRCTRT